VRLFERAGELAASHGHARDLARGEPLLELAVRDPLDAVRADPDVAQQDHAEQCDQHEADLEARLRRSERLCAAARIALLRAHGACSGAGLVDSV
jgi:hypothetical protein